jgi:bleomycin hydrolase
MKQLIILTTAVLLMLYGNLAAQRLDKAILKEYKPGFYENSILKGIEEFEQPAKPTPRRSFKVDVTGLNAPTDPDQYKKYWHNTPVSQGNTGTCWCFATTSFYETEAYRIGGQQIKLSEMFSVYWEYVERAKEYVRTRGNMFVGEGSEANAVTRSYKLYGAVPLSAYTGLKEGQKYHSHAKMFAEIEAYFKSIKAANVWNEAQAVETVKSIMNYYIGIPPSQFAWQGKNYTPQSFLKEVLKLNMDDYVEILSLSTEPFYKKVEYKVEDNWWHSADYFNVPLEDYMAALKKAIRNGFTVSIGGDVSEAGFVSDAQIAIVPTFDIPAEYINDDARAFRFLNKTTTDDHGMHLVGYTEKEGKDWYLIKDSGAGSRSCGQGCKQFGYYFFHEDYVKLKMMGFTVHKDAVKNLLQKGM